MSANNDNNAAPPAPQRPSIFVSPASPPASSSPSAAAPVESPARPQSTVHTSSSAVSQAEAFLATVNTPQRAASPSSMTTAHARVAVSATVTQASAVSTNGESSDHSQTVASPSKPAYNGTPLPLKLVAELSQNYEDLMTDLSILRGEFDKEKPTNALQVAYKAEIKNRGFEQMRDHFELGEDINDLEREVRARLAAEENHTLTKEMADNMVNEINKYNDFKKLFENKKEEIAQMRLALERMGTQPGEQYYTYALNSQFDIIGNQMAPLAHPTRTRRKSSKMDTPKQGTPRQETPMLMDYTPMAETPLGQISPNKRKSASASTPVTGLGEHDDDSRRRSGRVAKRAKAEDFEDMNGTPSGKGKALAKGEMGPSKLFPNLPMNRKTKTNGNSFMPVNTASTYTSATSPYAPSPYEAYYPAPTPQTEEAWMSAKSAEMETILSNIQIHKNQAATLEMETSSRVRRIQNLDQDIHDREAHIGTLEKTIRDKQQRLDAQEKNIRNNDTRLLKAKDAYTEAQAAFNGKVEQENEVDKRLATKKREEKALDARILELKEEVKVLEQEKASKK